jgi:hypothetical protein
MIKWNEAGLVITSDEIETEQGKLATAMFDEIVRLNKELKWWRDYAFQMNTNADNEEEPF